MRRAFCLLFIFARKKKITKKKVDFIMDFRSFDIYCFLFKLIEKTKSINHDPLIQKAKK